MYKDKSKERSATAERVRRYRNKAKGVTDNDGLVTPDVTPIEGSKEAGWLAVDGYIRRESPGMENLERLKRISGSLGSHASEVMYGPTALTFKDIGEVLGVEPGKYGK